MGFEVSDKFADYEVISVLGTGGMGRVYKVRNLLSNRLEAMKVLLPDSAGMDDRGERFLREIRVHASLDHPNIAAQRTALRVDNQVVMIMELVEGTTLQEMISRGPLPLRTALNYMAQALSALSYAHQKGVIHRDIKPANIMVTVEGTVKLMDFGIAKMDLDRSLTTTGATMGSLYYMSPEQVKGGPTLDARSDLYSLGMTFYEVITGARPFSATQDFAIMTAHLNDPPIPPRQKNPGIPAELNQAILKSLAKNPIDRFQTASEFRSALEQMPPLPEDASSTKIISTSSVSVLPPTTDSRSSSTAGLEMAYVLFMDIVAYSSLPMDRQSERITQLVEIVRNTGEFSRAHETGQLISLPTGDGMALVFFKNPAAPVQCATEISRKLATHPEIKLRMGIHNGPVYRIPDINTNLNVAGGGINMAQRVMDCGDAGHILVSKTVAEVLGQLSDWAGCFHDLGEAEVKHGVKVQLVNFCKDDVGNPGLPQKLRNTLTVQRKAELSPQGPRAVDRPGRRNVYAAAGGGGLLVALLVFGTMQFTRTKEPIKEPNPGPQPVKDTNPSPKLPPPPPPSGTSNVTDSGAGGSNPVGGGVAKPPVKTPGPTIAPSKVVDSGRGSVTPPVQPGPPPGTGSNPVVPPPAPVPTPGPAPGQQSTLSAQDKAALQEQRERMIQISARAAAVRNSLQNLERQQSKTGLSLRADMVSARESMNYLLDEAKMSLATGDVSITKRNLDLAEQQVSKLERFLGQ